MATLTDIPRKTRGAAFLIEESTPQDIFTPEDLSEEHLAVGHMVDEFWANEVEPNLPFERRRGKRQKRMDAIQHGCNLGVAKPEQSEGVVAGNRFPRREN